VAIAGVAQNAATGGMGGSSSGGGTRGGGVGGGSTSNPPAADGSTGILQEPSAPPAASGQDPASAPPPQTPEQIEKQNLENQKTKLSIGEQLPPPLRKKVQENVAKETTKKPEKPPIKRQLLFSFTYMKNKPMYGAHHIILTDTATNKKYDSAANRFSIAESTLTLEIDSSVKEAIVNVDSIVGPPIDYSAILDPTQAPKKPSDNVQHHLSGQKPLFIEGVTTFMVSGGVRSEAITAKSKQDLQNKINASLGGKGTVGVLEISPTIGGESTSSSGSETERKYDVIFLDTNVGLDIEALTKPDPKK
jgi:hypothetical protein